MQYLNIILKHALSLQAGEDDKPTDLFTSEGLKPSMDDLDNLFDDSSDETEAVSTSPSSKLYYIRHSLSAL